MTKVNNKSENKQKSENGICQSEEQVLAFWKKENIFEKSVDKEAPKGVYSFNDGPPFATGTPHYGHLVSSIMKDVVPRYYTMQGYQVKRRWGWDCHGLPIENIVEKELDIKQKKEIEEIGVEKFNDTCRSKVLTYASDWEKVISRLGRWVDMKNPYRTMDLDFMESVWWVFKTLWDKNLIYQDYRSMHVCPRCETTLSQSEVSEGYKDIKDLSAIAKFKLEIGQKIKGEAIEKDTYILAWTTTPWTLIGNVALAVGEEIGYVVVKDGESSYILAKERLEEVFKDKEYELVSEFKGSDLLGLKYAPVFDYYFSDKNLENHENGWQVYAAPFVTTDEGTGIVHIAPAFGDDDMKLGREKNLPFIQQVGLDGYFKAEVKDFSGLNVKPIDNHMATDIEIIKYLAHNNLLFSKEKYEHSYPHCWRCDTPLINYATSSWFVSVLKIKDKLLETAKNVNWSPRHIKEGRFGNWLEGARDWSISRQRFWASAIPIWTCQECGEHKVIGSVKELEELSGEKINDIHKDKVDKISFSCDKCNGTMERIPDVLDCWFESGSMPYAQYHYPFENREEMEAGFPANFIAEGVDQTRAWFYYLHVISGGVKDSHAFNNAIVNGIVLAEDGKKMSKRLQNYPDPYLVMDKYGADALRMYLLSSPVMTAENINFSESGVQESLRKNVILLNNVFKFFNTYYDSYQGDLSNYNNLALESESVLDKWIIVKLGILAKDIESAMSDYNLPKAVRPITAFIDEFSTWYLRRSRDRFKSEIEEDRQSALSTAKYILTELSKLIASYMPFISENIWQSLSAYNFKQADKSVHLEVWPKILEIKNGEEVLAQMDISRKIAELGLAKRDAAKIKIRQMLGKLSVSSSKKIDKEYQEIVKDELNIQELEFVNSDDKNISVELDTTISHELRLEGLKREIIRQVNKLRKNLGLSLEDKTEAYVRAEGEIKETIEKFAPDIAKETSCSEFKLVEDDGSLDQEVLVEGNLVKISLKK